LRIFLQNDRGGLPIAALAPIVRRFASFAAVGLLGLGTDAGLFAWLAGHGTPEFGARAASLAFATVVTWRLNRRFTFGASGRDNSHELARYALVALSAQGLNYLMFVALRCAAPDLPAMAALVCGAGFAALFSFAGQHLFTFTPARTPAR
jgi:putative flippase GtrA